MPNDWVDAALAATRRLLDLATADEEFRGHLHLMASRFHAGRGPASPEPSQSDHVSDRDGQETGPSLAVARDGRSDDGSPPPAENGQSRPAPVGSPPTPPKRTTPLPPLTLGQAHLAPLAIKTASKPSAFQPPSDSELLEALEAHARLKAEGTRWAAKRAELIADGADFDEEIKPTDQDVHRRAYEIGNCRLWMNLPEFEVPPWEELTNDLAEGFETLAEAAHLARIVLPTEGEGHRPNFERALFLLAEAQSALRTAARNVDKLDEPDQLRAYGWLRDVTAARRYYIPRYMRADDPADPANLPDLRDRIAEALAEAKSARKVDRSRDDSFKRLRYHSRLLEKGCVDQDHQWQKLIDAVTELAAGGVPPSDVEIRDALLPIFEEMPDRDEVPQGFALALRELDRFLASRPPEPEPEEPEPPTAEVAEVARLLRGRNLVLIGGDRRPGAKESLETAFGLGELDWIATREHESTSSFESHVARPEVAAVLLAIRWASHSFGDVKTFCDTYGKPLVRLPGGYNPNRVAVEVLSQCSERLEATMTPEVQATAD